MYQAVGVGGMNGSGGPSRNPQNFELFKPHHAEASHTAELTRDQAKGTDLTYRQSKQRESRTLEPLPLTNMSRKTAMANSGDFIPPAGPARPSLNVIPISLASTPNPHPHRFIVEEVSMRNEKAGDSSRGIAASTETSGYNDQNDSPPEPLQAVDLTLTQDQSEQTQMIPQRTAEDTSATHVGSPEDYGRSSGSKPGIRSMGTIRSGRKPGEKAPTSPRTPLGPVRQSKVTKAPFILQPQTSSVPLGNLAVSNGRSPSEEDLYYLLLHRYRKREHTEKQLAVRLRQLESQNTEIGLAAQEYKQQLEIEIASSGQQAARISAQKLIIDNIKSSYLKIKEFMKNVCEEQEVLKHKAVSMDRHRQALRNEHDGFRITLDDAQNATVLSSNVMSRIRTDIAELREAATLLENSLHNTCRDLQNKESLLMQEQHRNTKYENHISEVTRNHNIFNSTIRQEQQHLSSALKSIQDNLSDLKTHQAQFIQPSSVPALDYCVKMLKELVKRETASPADVTDMIQIVQGLTER